MSWLVILLLVLLVLLAGALLCPVRYRCEADSGGGILDISFFFGLYRKRFQWPSADRAERSGTPDGGGWQEREEISAPAEEETPPDRGTAYAMQETAPAAERGGSDGTDAEKPAQDATEGCGTADIPRPSEYPCETEAEMAREVSSGELLRRALENGSLFCLLHMLRRLYRHLRPAAFFLSGRAGLGDPADTGMAAGLLYAALPGSVRIDWDYTEPCLALSFSASGRAVPGYILWLLAGLWAAKPVRELMRYRKSGAPDQ